MSRRRRGILLAGLALVLGALAASDVAGREAALDRRIGPLVDVVVARGALPADVRITPQQLAVRQVPARFAPAGAFASPGQLVGRRLGSPLGPGADVVAAALDQGGEPVPGAPVRAGERVADVVAVGAAAGIQPGGRVDVLVTRDRGNGAPGRTALALEDVEVLAVRPAASGGADDKGAPRVVASLRVSLHDAVFLAAAQSFASEIRLLPRAAGDHRAARGAVSVDDGLSG